jgi:hypothetical protein
MTEQFYRRMFLVGAIWNLSGAVFVWLFMDWIFALANMPTPDPAAFYYSWIALFATYGIGVYMVYKDMYANTNMVVLGIIGKVSFALIFVYYYVSGTARIPPFFWIAVVGDLIFAALFATFLFGTAERRRQLEQRPASAEDML